MQREAHLCYLCYLCCPNILTVYHEKRTKMISELRKVSPKKQYTDCCPAFVQSL